MTPYTRYICTKCGRLTQRTTDDQAVGRKCDRCEGWASTTTSPVGRYAAHRMSIDIPEADAYCQHQIDAPPGSVRRTGIPLIDNGGARICPHLADGDDNLCAFHRIGGTVKSRLDDMIESLF